MSILVTGGAGFIGAHSVVEFIESREKVVVIDNFANSSMTSIKNIKTITNTDFDFYEADCSDENLLESIFKQHEIEAVVHFAGLKAVGDSVKFPLIYYYENIKTMLSLLKVMSKFNCKKIIFSSSATVYGKDNKVPFVEGMPVQSSNPYGETKIIIEKILQDICKADLEFSAVCLRYFNPIGAHKSGLLGDMPTGVPNNLMPYIVQVASGQLECLHIFGDDYNTIDGTGVRDYIHVVDLSLGHLNALNFCRNNNGFEVFNLGTGVGYSVLQLVKSFEKVTGIEIKKKIVGRRAGDVALCYCNPEKALVKLNWRAERSLDEMCADAWNFERRRFNM